MKKKPRGWVFKVGRSEVGFAAADEFLNAEEAYNKFSRQCGDEFDIWFRDSKGVLNSTACESRQEDFV